MAILTYGSGCITDEKLSIQPSTEGNNVNDSLIEIVSKYKAVSSLIPNNQSFKITVLYPENMTQLSKKYPVIYGSLPNKTLYRIDYMSQRGMLVIVDLENKTVLRYFMTAGVIME
jgi:hypothetical protein